MYFDPLIVWIARIIIGLLFVFTAILKIKDLRGFYLIFLQYGLFKPKFAKQLAYAHPFVELIVGFLMIYDAKFLFAASLSALALMVVATFFVAYGYIKNLKMKNCGCYGSVIESPLSIKKILENLLWIAIITYILLSGAYCEFC